MALDSVLLTALCRELEPELLGAKIDRITMPAADVVVLFLHTKNGKKKLLLSAGSGTARLHFTEQSFENPEKPPMFCMLLRKHLSAGRILAVEQPPMERMVTLRLSSLDEMGVAGEKRLILELMGKSRNLVLVDSEGRVIDCLRRADPETNEKRPLLPGLFYKAPPVPDKPNFFALTAEERRSIWARGDTGLPPDKRLLDSFNALSPLVCREMALDENMEEAMERLATLVKAGFEKPVLLSEQGRPRDFCFMPIRQYGKLTECEECESFSELLDSFYTRRERQDAMRVRAADLLRCAKTACDRQLRKRDARARELKDTERMEEHKRRGDLVTANIYRLKKGMSSFEAEDFYQEGCPVVTVPLDLRKTPQQNAAAYYKQYTKARTARKVLTELAEGAEAEIAYLETVLDELNRAESERDLAEIRRELTEAGYLRAEPGKRRTPPPRKPLRYRTSRGLEIRVGRSNAENDTLTLKTARRTDLWFHVQKLPGSHVILSQESGVAEEQDLREAALIAAVCSGAGKGARTAVDYTMVRNVKKPSGARPGFVIYTGQSTLTVEADEAAAEALRIQEK